MAATAPHEIAPRLLGAFAASTGVYLGSMALLWCVGIESIYGHPTPFYALFYPAVAGWIPPLAALGIVCGLWLLSERMRPWPGSSAFETYLLRLPVLAFVIAFVANGLEGLSVKETLAADLPRVPYHIGVAVLACGGIVAAVHALGWIRASNQNPSTRFLVWYLFGLVVFSVVFSCAMAALRGGAEGIFQSYLRGRLEFTGDIGVASSIQDLFRRYATLQPHLSLHGRVHPPGPIALLWAFSYLVGQDPLPLALCTVFIGALAVVPMFLWTAEIGGPRFGLLAATVYALVPSVVLFTATSSDILFTPVTLATLWLFERAVRRRGIASAIGAGIGYGLMSLLKYSLLTVGAYFGFVGLWMLRDRAGRRTVIQTAALMVAALGAVHAGVWWWSQFDFIASFKIAKAYVDHDRFYEYQLAPRASLWWWKLLNPLCWFYFAGIPVSVLFCGALFRSEAATRTVPVLFALTFATLSLLYLGAGEGERSALYAFPFLVIPAALRLEKHCANAASLAPLGATLGFLALQCWLTEVLFYTYW